MEQQQSGGPSIPPPPVTPAPVAGAAQRLPADPNKKLFGIAALVLAVGVVVVAAIVLIPFSNQYLAERKLDSAAELELKKQQLELDKLKTNQQIAEQNRANTLSEEKAAADAIAREKDLACGAAGADYFAAGKRTPVGKFANFELSGTHYNSVLAACLIKVKYSRGLQGQYEIYNAESDTQLKVWSWGTTYPNDPQYDVRETAAGELLMTQ